jgi:hypothetical protein
MRRPPSLRERHQTGRSGENGDRHLAGGTIGSTFSEGEANLPRIRELAGAVLPVIALIGWLAARGTAVTASAGSILSGVPHPTDTMVFTLASTGGNCNGCEWIAAEGPEKRC